MVDIEKSRRETLRWLILVTLNAARPRDAGERMTHETVRQELPDVTVRELRQQLDYLAERELIRLEGRNGSAWRAKLTRYGVDIVEHTVDCEPGIARPQKYWDE